MRNRTWMNKPFQYATIGAFIILNSFANASAQSVVPPFPGAVNINGGWVPCDHPIAVQAGFNCTGNPGYDYVPTGPTATAVFTVGQTIRQPYPSYRAIVVSVGSDNGRTIVTARITRTAGSPLVGEYIAFDAARTQWFPLAIHDLP